MGNFAWACANSTVCGFVAYTSMWRYVVAVLYGSMSFEKFHQLGCDKEILKQAGTGPSRRHIQGSKIAKRLPSVKYSLLHSKIENFTKKILRKKYILKKMDLVARRGPLSRAPGVLKGGHFRNCQHFCRSWRGFVAKQQKIEGGTLWGKKIRKKSLAVPKKMEGGTLWSRRVWYVTRENRKNLFGSIR